MKRKKIILLGIVGVVLLGVTGWNGYGWWLKHKLERYKTELSARGEKLTIAEIIANRREPEFNRADVFLRASTLIRADGLFRSNPPLAMRLVAPGRAMVGWQQPVLIDRFDWGEHKGPLTNTWAEFAEDLARSREGISLLHEMIEHPNLDFHLSYNAGASLMIPHLSPLKYSALALSYAALVDLHNGNAASAAQHLRGMLALAKGARDEPLLISQLVRIAITQIAISVTWELLQSPNVGDADLKAIQTDFAELDFRASMEQAFTMERAMRGMTIRHYREQGGIFELGAFSGGAGTGTTTTNFAEQFEEHAKRTFSPRALRKNSSELLWQSALSYEDELRHLQSMEMMIDGLRSATNRGWVDVIRETAARLETSELMSEESADELLMGPGDDTSLAQVRTMLAGVGSWSLKCLNKVEFSEASRTLVTTAIALKRYELRHAKVPDDLSALVPEFLGEPPRDPVDRKPLRYRVAADRSWTLYSVGKNGLDDGGDPKSESDNSFPKRSTAMLKGRDWVWPQPATLEEINAWEAKELHQN